MTAEQASEKLGVVVRELQRLASVGRLETHRLTRGVKRGDPRTFYTVESINRELEYRRQQQEGNGNGNGNPGMALAKREVAIESARVHQAQADFWTGLSKHLASIPEKLELLGVAAKAPAPEWYSVAEAAKLLGMPQTFLRKAIADGRLKAVRGRVKWANVKALEA